MTIEETTIEQIHLPKRIYKYRKWNNHQHRRILTHNEIKFTSPLDCEEQHEFNLPTDYDSVTDTMLYNYYYLKAPENVCKTNKSRHDFAEYMKNVSSFHDNIHRKKVEEEFRQELNKKISIFCASPYKDNFNLWSSFAGGNSGFCIGFNTLKMFDSTELFHGGGKVNYYPQDALPKIKPFYLSDEEALIDIQKVIYTLPDIFAGEEEYRLVKWNVNNQTVNINTDSIDEIILTEHISPKIKLEILQIVKSKLPHVEIQQVQTNQETNSITFNPVNYQ